MSRRIDIEITSLNGETATWRAAGAKLPKGVLNVSLVPGDATVGTVYRADVEQYMEGMEVLAVIPAKTASPLDPRHERLELIPTVSSGPDVVVTYAPKGRSPRRDGERGAPRRPGDRPVRDRAPRDRAPRERAPREATPADESGEAREARAPRERRDGSTDRSSARPARGPRPERGPRTDRGPRTERGPRPLHPPVTTAHRNALLATLSPEQLPVAEQLLRGGMPSVRSAVAEQNQTAHAQGRPTVDPVTIDRIALDLVGRTNLAMWKDRAAGAIGAGKEMRLRDLRAVVTSAKTVSHDEESRAQLKELQASLTTRLDAMRTAWNSKLETAITAGNVVETLRLVARPPDMSTRVSAETAQRVVTITSDALRSDQDAALWRTIVVEAAETSVRRNVKPQGIPDDDESRAVALHHAGAIPELAKLLGMKVPPPPPPTRSVRRTPTRRAS
ncbi:MAG: hypothetical protein ACRDV0_04900 [Acidimicrobiales bacterium]